MYKQSLFAITALAMLTSSSLTGEELDDIIVTAKSNKSIRDLAGSVTVITAEDIKKLNATNVLDVLVKSAGITSAPAGTNYGRQNISIRGSQSDHVLILVDGKKVSGSDALISMSDYQYSWVPMNSIERIEIIKGAGSSLYGSEAIGGVINIITKKSDNKFYGDFDVKFGSSKGKGGASKEFSLNLGGKVTEDLSLSLNAEKKDIEVIEKDNTTYIEGKDYNNGKLSLSYDFDDTQTLSASYLAGSEKRMHINDELYYDIDRESYDLSYSKDFKDISLKLDYYHVESDNYLAPSMFEYTHNVINETFKAEVEVESFENNYIVFGVEYKTEEYNKMYDKPSATKVNSSFSQNNKAYFVQDEIELGEDFIVTLGARYDDHEQFGGELSPKANLVYKLSTNQRLKFGISEGFVAPTVKENSSTYVFSGYSYTIYGNANLSPETSRNYDLSYEYYSDDVDFKVSIFNNDVKNLITTEEITATTYTYANIGDVSMKGVETEIDYNINENNDLKFNYTYLKAINEETKKSLTYRPKSTANLILNSQLAYDVSSTFSISYIGKQYDGSEYLNAYTRGNIQLSKNLTDDLNVRIGMDNITNNRLKSDDIESKGRFTYIGLNYKF